MSHAACITVHLNALCHNWKCLAQKAGAAECAAVVKGNAYGIGLEQAACALFKAGCRTFFVAHLEEGQKLRRFIPDSLIYVLNGLLPDTVSLYKQYHLRPVLGSMSEISLWNECHLPAALHIDTGMNRLGLSVADLGQALHVKPSLIMSHFVSSEEPRNSLNNRQIEIFNSLKTHFPDVPFSLSNSSGLFLKQQPFYDLVRPGYALYGGNPTPDLPNPMQPVVTLTAPVLQVHHLQKGETAGYNGQWTAQVNSTLATVSIGYADGYPRSAGGTDEKIKAGAPYGAALVRDVLCPLAGRVSMDLIIVDVSNLKGAPLQPGENVTLIGGELTIDEMAHRAGTIGYEVLTRLGERYKRVYKN